jgi:hypothetical protein
MADLVANTLVATELYSYGDALVALVKQPNIFFSLEFATLTAAGAWAVYQAALPPATAVRSVGNVPPLATGVIRASAAVTSNGTYGCVLQQTATQTVVHVFEMATGTTINHQSLASGTFVRKVVSMGTVFGIVENTTTALRLQTADPTAATNPGVFSLTATLVTAAVTWFDVAVAELTTPTALHLAYIVGGAVSYGKYSFAGVQSGSTKNLAAALTAETVSLCSDDTNVHAAYQDDATHELSLISFSATSPYTTAAGPTAIDAGVAVVEGLYCLVPSRVSASVQVVTVAYAQSAGANDLGICSFNERNIATHALTRLLVATETQLAGGFLTDGQQVAAGVLRFDQANGTSLGGASSQAPVSMYMSPRTCQWFTVDYGLTSESGYFVHPPMWPGRSPSGDALVLLPRDDTPNFAGTPVTVSVRAVRVDLSARRPGVQLADALYIAGGALCQWDGGLVENGMLASIITSLSQSNTADGAIANGVYDYRAVMVWQDERNRTHRSPVALAKRTTTTGANDTVTASVAACKTMRRNANLITNPRIELYRTEAGPGELFYLTASATVDTTTDATSLVDIRADASLISQPTLYTQGEFGATSGILEQAPGIPCSFVAATKRRLVLGSADTLYQWSQTTLPEIPVFFTQPGISGDAAQAFLDDVDGGALTGVATLDEVVFVGTKDRIYVTGGTGPNLAGTGEFSPPTQLPADVGFYNHLSILETSEGLWFLGDLSTFYLIARGTPTPVISHAVQERLTTAIVGCGYDATDNLAAWASAGGQLILRQLDIQQWFGDSLPFTPIALHSHRGALYAIASDGVVWRYDPTAYGDGAAGATAVALRVATGQIGPFEMAGWGRLAVVELLGEFQAAAAILAEISYDDGLTWTSLGTHTVTGLSVGAAFQRQWHPLRQRGDRFRARFTMTPSVTTTEGCRLTGCVVQYAKRSGPARLAASNRK